MSRRLAILILSSAAVAACSVNRVSDGLKCTTQADCAAGRTCTSGYCLGSNAIVDTGSAATLEIACGSGSACTSGVC